jgi:ferredoxin
VRRLPLAAVAPVPGGGRGVSVRPTVARVVVDPVACDGIGMCAHLAPDLVRVDTWGFPIIAGDPLTAREQRQARKAVAGCPRKALLLADAVPTAGLSNP